jgi:hypothetical protein
MLQALIGEARVDAHDAIEPTFRVPRLDRRRVSVHPAELKSNRSALILGGPVSLDEAE